MTGRIHCCVGRYSLLSHEFMRLRGFDLDLMQQPGVCDIGSVAMPSLLSSFNPTY